MNDHVHVLVRIPPKLALATLYGQMKGFATHAMRERDSGHPFRWQDGVCSVTVDPDKREELRRYIRNQWEHHETGGVIEHWEAQDPGP